MCHAMWSEWNEHNGGNVQRIEISQRIIAVNNLLAFMETSIFVFLNAYKMW